MELSDVEYHGRLLIVRLAGDVIRAQVTPMLPEIIRAAAQRECSGVLLDCRLSDILPRAEERIMMAAEVSEVWPRALAMAILMQPELLVPDSTFVHVLTKFGVTAETFHNREEALRWLQRGGEHGDDLAAAPTPKSP